MTHYCDFTTGPSNALDRSIPDDLLRKFSVMNGNEDGGNHRSSSGKETTATVPASSARVEEESISSSSSSSVEPTATIAATGIEVLSADLPKTVHRHVVKELQLSFEHLDAR